MADEHAVRTLHCYASGRDGQWEAICLDLNIAVQGDSFDEVMQSLKDGVSLYLETVFSLPAQDRAHLLHRPSPLSVRMKFLGYALRHLLNWEGGDRYHHQFTMPAVA